MDGGNAKSYPMRRYTIRADGPGAARVFKCPGVSTWATPRSCGKRSSHVSRHTCRAGSNEEGASRLPSFVRSFHLQTDGRGRQFGALPLLHAGQGVGGLVGTLQHSPARTAAIFLICVRNIGAERSVGERWRASESCRAIR